MYYNVYIMEFEGTPYPHLSLFVQCGPSIGGVMHHVRGAIEVDGMAYERKQVEESTSTFRSFLSLQLQGTVQKENLPRLDSICESIPPPAKQFGPDGPINPGVPRRRCKEWIIEVLDKLKAEKVLEV